MAKKLDDVMAALPAARRAKIERRAQESNSFDRFRACCASPKTKQRLLARSISTIRRPWQAGDGALERTQRDSRVVALTNCFVDVATDQHGPVPQ